VDRPNYTFAAAGQRTMTSNQVSSSSSSSFTATRWSCNKKIKMLLKGTHGSRCCRRRPRRNERGKEITLFVVDYALLLLLLVHRFTFAPL
jgi:hypothetical protein